MRPQSDDAGGRLPPYDPHEFDSTELGSDATSISTRHSWRTTAMLAFQSLGVVYGDIGTSPLYVFSSIFPDASSSTSPIYPSQDDIIGALSLIIWSLLLIVILKYCIFILLASNQGEGGNFSLYALVQRGRRAHLPTKVLSVLSILNLVAVGMLLGDGVLTPAISVLSAIEGLEVAAPSVKPAVVPVAIVILFALFVVQSYGSGRIGSSFAPIIIIWFAALTGIGIYNLTLAPYVLKAFSPSYGMEFFIRHGTKGWESLGAVVLCITGVEALYADMGHFGRTGVRLSASIVTIPALIITYCGQAASLVTDPTKAASTFYLTVPSGGAFYLMLVLATLATVIASQAMISASYTIVHLAMQVDAFPRMTVRHTSKMHSGQIYVPEINYILMFLVIVIVLAFRSSASLAAAYGIAVCHVMLTTTLFFSIAIWNHFGRHWAWGVVFFCFFGVIDGAFWTANIVKVESGGWVAIVIAFVFSLVMIIYRWGRVEMGRHMDTNRVEITDLFPDTDEEPEKLDALLDSSVAAGVGADAAIMPMRVLVVLTTREDVVPMAFAKMATFIPLMFDCTIFIHAHKLEKPYSRAGLRGIVDVSTNLRVERVARKVYSLSLEYGYADTPGAADLIVQRALAAILQRYRGMTSEAAAARVTTEPLIIGYLNGKENVIVGAMGSVWHRLLVSCFQALLWMSRSTPAILDLPAERLIEVGTTVAM